MKPKEDLTPFSPNEGDGAAIGPIFLRTAPPALPAPNVIPLGITMELAWQDEAYAIPLFKNLGSLPKDGFSFNDIVLRESDMPCDATAMAFFVADTLVGRFFPLDSILFALYRRRAWPAALEKPPQMLCRTSPAATGRQGRLPNPCSLNSPCPTPGRT